MTYHFKQWDPEGPTQKWQRRLPHWEQEGCTYFSTFRTADSIPQSLLAFLELEKNHWIRQHPRPWNEQTILEYSNRFVEPVERWFDRGLGGCELAKPASSRLVEDSLRFFDTERYLLDEYVVMPNHVHCLVLPFVGVTLKEILKGCKSFSSKKINQLRGIQGRFWMEESFDRIVRDEAELEVYRLYIRQNLRKANLAGTSKYRIGCGAGIDY